MEAEEIGDAFRRPAPHAALGGDAQARKGDITGANPLTELGKGEGDQGPLLGRGLLEARVSCQGIDLPGDPVPSWPGLAVGDAT
ncbi:MAG: hypothetical protein HY702_01095 [Gemmatimonadetes bacterium]|nr:hypothetical protein [Gemmatimonadota bacterium]